MKSLKVTNASRIRQKALRLFMLIGFVLLLLINSVTVLAQETAFYEDPTGNFSVPVPPGWINESTAEVGRFVSPDGVSVSLLAVEGADAESGVRAVLAALAPDLATIEPLQIDALPLPSGNWTQSLYAPAEDRFAALLTQWVDDVSYALLFETTTQDALVLLLQQKLPVGMAILFSVGERFDLSSVRPQPFTAEKQAELEAFIENARERFHVPAASIAVVQDGEIVYTGGFGMTEVNGSHPVTAETLFMIGSVTKSMTSMMIGTLVDDGVLDWDQPVTDILPSFALSNPDVTAQLRMRDLLNMSSGVPPYDDIIALIKFTPEELIASLAEIPLVSPPGTIWNYSNQMVAAGGYISALAAGVPLDALDAGYINLVQQQVFDTIGMLNTTFDFDAAVTNPNHALPCNYNPLTQEYDPSSLDGTTLVGERTTVPVAPAGAVWSNAEDMARYLQTELSGGVSPDGERVISEAALHTTQTVEVGMAGPWFGYGMGWIIDSYNNLPLVWHRGNTSGFTSNLSFLPSANLGVVTLTNAGSANNFNDSIREYVFELVYGLGHASSERFAALQAAEEAQMQAGLQAATGMPVNDDVVDPDAVAPYLGNYHYRSYEYDVTVEMRGSELWLVGAFVQSPLHPTGDVPNEYTGIDALSNFVVRFTEAGDQVTMEIISLSTGEIFTFNLITE